MRQVVSGSAAGPRSPNSCVVCTWPLGRVVSVFA